MDHYGFIPAAGTHKYDFMSFGEAMVRFTPPGHDRFGQAEELQLGIAAAELNCCVNISNLSRVLLKPTMKTAFVTKMVDAWDGDYIIKHAQMHAVDMSNVVVQPYDKIGRNGRNGKCFIEVGIGPRPSYQGYDRGHSAVSMIKRGDIDWEKVLDTRWFHSTGIVTAVGEHTVEVVGDALKAAKKNGAVTSYDLNYRHTLWSQDAAKAAMVELMPYIDVIIGNEEDFETMLGIKADNTDANYSKIDPNCYRAVAEKVMEKYPNVKVVGNSLREVKSALLNNWQTVMMTQNGYFVSRKYYDIEIYDRVGGGDSFASGLIWNLLNDKPEQEAIDFAAAYSALCHTIRNDWDLVTTEEAYDVMKGGSARVKR
ncbi:MAG: sugar kinase [Firmicutes bacterium]|nr:sugar kinase [Bacillota bacterium]